MWRWKDKKLGEFNTKRIAKNWSTYIVLAMALGAMTFFGVCDPGSGRGGNVRTLSGAAAKVDGNAVTSNEFKRVYQDVLNRYQKQFKGDFDPATMQLASLVLNNLVDQRILYIEAVNNGLYTTEDEVIDMISKIDAFKDEKGQFDWDKFATYLRYNYYTEKAFTEQLRMDMSADKFRNLIMETNYIPKSQIESKFLLAESKLDIEYLDLGEAKVDARVSSEEVANFLNDEGKKRVKEYYSRNQDEFNQKKKVKARHILIGFEGARNATGEAASRSKEDAEKRAKMVLAEATKDKANFPKLAEQYTDDASGKNKGGDLGFFEQDTMVKEFSNAAFAMNPGEISNVVESPFGFHVIMVNEVQDPITTSLEQATPKIAEKLVKDEKKPKLQEKLAADFNAALAAGQGVEALATSYNLNWMGTGEFTLESKFIPGFGSDAKIKAAALTLTKANPVYHQAVESNGKKYVLRLKSRKDANLADLTPAKRDELSKQLQYTESYALFASIGEVVKKRYKDTDKVWMNADYLAIDTPSSTGTGASPGTATGDFPPGLLDDEGDFE